MTPIQFKALEWFAANGPIGWFDANAPTRHTRRRLEQAGWIAPLPAQSMQVLKFEITEAGRKALAARTPT